MLTVRSVFGRNHSYSVRTLEVNKMTTSNTRNRIFIAIISALAILLTVPAFSLAAKKDKKKDYVMTEVELQSELMSYADRFASIITQAFEDFETLKPKPQARQFILSDLVYSLSAVYTIAAEPNPQVGLLGSLR